MGISEKDTAGGELGSSICTKIRTCGTTTKEKRGGGDKGLSVVAGGGGHCRGVNWDQKHPYYYHY